MKVRSWKSKVKSGKSMSRKYLASEMKGQEDEHICVLGTNLYDFTLAIAIRSD